MGERVKVGVIGGTFDPIHIAHLIAAEEARARLGLAQVLFAPAGTPWHRGGIPVSPAHHRTAMVRLAIASNPDFKLSTVDVDRSGPTYTVDTIRSLREEMGPDAEFYFILGLDSVADLPRWKDPEVLIQLCHLVAVPRPGFVTFELASLELLLPGVTERVQILPMPLVGVSATEIRERVCRGLPVKYQVLEPVEAYIAEHELYQVRGDSLT